MYLHDFLKQVNGNESDIKNLSGDEVLREVKKDGDALRYVHDQTPEICMEAVNQDGDALRYVHDQTPEICMAAVKKDGYALRYVHVQTPEICIAAVTQDGGALRYVDKSVFDISTVKELTVADIEELLGYKVKIVK